MSKTNICESFEDINDNYTYGKFGPFNVVMMKINGFINATKLCKDAGERFRDWTDNKNSKKFTMINLLLS